jgi:1A family penicillin-binding protein
MSFFRTFKRNLKKIIPLRKKRGVQSNDARKKRQRTKKKLSVLKIVAYLFLFFFVIFIALSLVIIIWVSRLEIPSIDDFDSRKVEQSTKIYDRTGETLLFDIHGDVRRTIVPFNNISPYIRNATIAIEDAEFYHHNGIRPLRILKAIFDNIIYKTGQGGSTLTQQVVKNVYLTRQKTITRKVKEWILAMALEKKMTKDEILSVYLNEMPYGGNIYGAQEASRYFFGKDVSNITLAEAAYLASLPQRPSYFSPHGNHKDALERRKDAVLNKMLSLGFITKDEYKDAMEEDVIFSKFKNHNILAPHFVFYIRDYLIERYGEDVVYKGGLRVTTTINTELQQAGERIINRYATLNETKFNAENASLVAIDPKTGQVLAMVGSRDYFDEKIDGKFNIATAHRQPGSTFKPIVYATAFERGLTSETVVFDTQTQFSTNCLPDDFSMKNGCYSPVNYDGHFRGPMTLRNALAQSINIPAIKVLYLVGIKNALEKARLLGVESLTKSARHYGLSLVLGGGEVSLLELTGAYSTFANNGTFNKPVGILKIEDTSGNILEEYEQDERRVFSQNTASTISNILSDNTARAPAYGYHSFLNFGRRNVAAKTGTTNDFRDVWVVGYTPTIAVGTWAGNNDNSPIVKKVAGFVIAPMWRAFMDEALKIVKDEDFTKPSPLPQDIKPILNGNWQQQFAMNGIHSILHFVNKNNPRGENPHIPASDAQYTNWEYPVQLWTMINLGYGATSTEATSTILQQANMLIQNTQQMIQNNNTSSPQDNTTTIQTTNKTSLHIVNPVNNSTVRAGVPLMITLAVNGVFSKVDYYLNGVYIGASVKNPYSITILPQKRTNINIIKAVGRTNTGGVISDTIHFNTK